MTTVSRINVAVGTRVYGGCTCHPGAVVHGTVESSELTRASGRPVRLLLVRGRHAGAHFIPVGNAKLDDDGTE